MPSAEAIVEQYVASLNPSTLSELASDMRQVTPHSRFEYSQKCRRHVPIFTRLVVEQATPATHELAMFTVWFELYVWKRVAIERIHF